MLLTKRELLLKIAEAPDDAYVLVPSSDHSYRPAEARVESALFSRRSHEFSEDFGDKHKDKLEIRITAIIIS